MAVPSLVEDWIDHIENTSKHKRLDRAKNDKEKEKMTEIVKNKLSEKRTRSTAK